jgi:hypothetical protein
MAKQKKSAAQAALGPIPEEPEFIPPAPNGAVAFGAKNPPPSRRVVAKDAEDAWPQMFKAITKDALALMQKHVEKIKAGHRDAGLIDNPKDDYRISFTAIINDENPDKFEVEVKIAYPTGSKESFSVRTKDSSKSQVAVGEDLADKGLTAAEQDAASGRSSHKAPALETKTHVGKV